VLKGIDLLKHRVLLTSTKKSQQPKIQDPEVDKL
jgi:hypothetical protein